jgi:WXG100 family type VII secretion target
MLVVDFERLQAAVDRMAEFGRDVAELLEDVERSTTNLRSTWHGEASDAQAQAQRQWEDGAEQMRMALSQMQKVAEAAHKNYTDAVSKNGQMWETK